MLPTPTFRVIRYNGNLIFHLCCKMISQEKSVHLKTHGNKMAPKNFETTMDTLTIYSSLPTMFILESLLGAFHLIEG